MYVFYYKEHSTLMCCCRQHDGHRCQQINLKNVYQKSEAIIIHLTFYYYIMYLIYLCTYMHVDVALMRDCAYVI